MDSFHNTTLYLLIFRFTSINASNAAIVQRPLNQRNSEENNPPKKATECIKQVLPNNQSMNFNSFEEYLQFLNLSHICINFYCPDVLQFFLMISRIFKTKNRRKTKAMIPLTQQYVCPVVNPVQKEREFQTKRIVEQIVEINNELKLFMIFTSIQIFRTFYIIVHLNTKIYKVNYHKGELDKLFPII